MSLLLDTHIILWWLTDDETLSDGIKDTLEHAADVYVSPASLWEITIKQSIGKLKAPSDLAELVVASGFRPMPIVHDHAIAAGRLPPIHRDPFDRMLVAQARCEDLTLVTRDPEIRRYEVETLAG